MVKISRKMIWAALFIIVMAAGTFILLWISRPAAEDTGRQIGGLEENKEAEEDITGREARQKEPPREIPPGMKEINLPVNFFGDHMGHPFKSYL